MPARRICAASSAALLAACTPPGEGPVFPGHPLLTHHTKELALEGSAVAFGDGKLATAAGASVAAFYRPWFSFVGGATFSLGSRKHYDTRAMVRLVLPEPLLGQVFPYAAAGVTVFFPETAPRSGEYERFFGFVFGAGAFVQVTRKTRVRLEVRDAWLPSGRALEHDGSVTVALVLLAR